MIPSDGARYTRGACEEFARQATHTPPHWAFVRPQEDSRLSVDEARLLPRARASAGPFLARRRMERSQAEALGNASAENPSAPMPARLRPVPSPGELRGIPVTGHGGASPGSNPESHIDRIDRELERRRRAQAEDEAWEPMVAFA